MNVHIRDAQPADLPALLAAMADFYVLEKLPWKPHRQASLLEHLLANPESGRLLLLEQAGKMAGYAVIGFCFSLEFDGRFALLDELYVLPHLQGQGLGTRLLQAAEACALAAGCQALRLEVSDDNPKARQLYERHGYQAVPRRILGRQL